MSIARSFKNLIKIFLILRQSQIGSGGDTPASRNARKEMIKLSSKIIDLHVRLERIMVLSAWTQKTMNARTILARNRYALTLTIKFASIGNYS